MQSIKLDLSLEETNAVLQALASQPYGAVAALIANIQKQAQPQLQPAADSESGE